MGQSSEPDGQDSTHYIPTPKLVYFGNEFPNDDVNELFRRLQQHSKDRRFRLLSAYLEDSILVLQDEIAKLPHSVNSRVPHFDNIVTLSENGYLRELGLGAAMESAFLLILQLGSFIGHHEATDSDFDLPKDVTIVAGLSVGLFSAAAIALSDSLAEVIKNGAECLRVSFRLGVYVGDFSSKLEAPQPEGALASWAYVVTGMDRDSVQSELTRVNQDLGNPEMSKVFISAADNSSVSVSGPPSRIKAAFLHSSDLRYSKSLALPVYDGLCHANHIYSQDDVNAVLNVPMSLIPTTRPLRLSVISSRTGKPFTATTASGLLSEIATELITGTIYLDNIIKGIQHHIGAFSGAKTCHIDSFRTSIIFKSILDAIAEDHPRVSIRKNDLVDWVHKDFGPRLRNNPANSKLAIVGMSCRMPGGANDPEEFWQLLEQGRDACTTIPPDRFDLETHYDPTGKTENAAQTPYGNFIDRPGYFDAAFFSMSPKEAEQTDPMQRLAIVTAFEAMEMAGLVIGRTQSTRRDRIGSYYGQASDDWRELNASQNIGTYAVPGGVRGFTVGRINYFFKLSGPCLCIDTACSSSMAAVHAACMALWAGDIDVALAGGVNIITDPDNYAGLGNAHFLSPTGQCKVWDKGADGYCRAEGVGSVVIKRLEDAEADNDNILAVILSAATNHSADAISITHPHAGHQKENCRSVLRKAGISPLEVGFVEMHGTGTQAGDAIESESVLDVFAPLKPRRRADQRLYLGAVKSNIGHGEAAAGISSLVKVLLMFQKNAIPPHIGIRSEVNPQLPKDLDRRNAGLVFQTTPWTKPAAKKRIALVNSFGAHGGNTTLLLEDAPERQRQRVSPMSADGRSAYAITVSAKSKKSLQGNLSNLLAYLEQNPDIDLADLSYTTCARRTHHNLRVATVVSSISGLQKFLRSSIDNNITTTVQSVPANSPSVVFAFTGQGASDPVACQELFDAFPVFRTHVLQLDQLVQRLGFPSVVPALTDSTGEGVLSPVVSQLSILVLEIALGRFWRTLGIRPSAVIGHSLGEYAALEVAGVLSAADVLYLIGRRAQITEQHCKPYSHSMLSVLASPEEIERLLRRVPETSNIEYEVSCQNTHEDTVLGGAQADIESIRKVLELNSYKCVLLAIPFAYHTSQMDVVVEELEKIAENIPFKAPSVPVLSTMLGTVVFDGKTINSSYLRRQTRGTVKFAAAVEAAQDMGLVDSKTVWVDLGPHPICIGLIRKIFPESRLAASCRRNEENLYTLTKSLATLHLAGITPIWNEYFRPNEQAYALLNLPKYSWNETNYWIPYLGTWTLDKALLKYGMTTPGSKTPATLAATGLRTSTIHQTTLENIESTKATLHVLSDMQAPEFRATMHGHTMNNCGVATSSIWTDMAWAVGDYLYRKVVPHAKEVYMNVCDLEVLHAQVSSTVKGCSQPLALEANLDLESQYMSLKWYNVSAVTGERDAEWFASAAVRFENPDAWTAEWNRTAHLVLGRIETLQRLAADGVANRISKRLAYTLFKNVVDYSDWYRGIDNLIMHEYEAVANITLNPDRHGVWHTPPHWIDSVCHLAGLIMNGSDASNTQDFFYVTPGSDSFRLLKPLEAGAKYVSYVRMFPLPVEAGNMHAGDVYILRDNVIVGVLCQIRFRRVPRLLLSRFFSPPNDSDNAAAYHTPAPQGTQAPSVSATTKSSQPRYNGLTTKPSHVQTGHIAAAAPVSQDRCTTSSSGRGSDGDGCVSLSSEASTACTTTTPPESESTDSTVVEQCIKIISRETKLNMSDLTADATFAQLGVDSLMSLVLSEKFRNELGIDVKSSLFIECPTIGEVKKWIDQNC
ncbi:ketoacyl-synt-domain-containing protein [Aspergillus costaricaensis CBS 115574]|uniref:Ketoacyl-synt-domain-containing protein n=1 Tax=Aspergillus costaricaensis CBS 115574 TaxID=1448317 RepID=A0ACD1ICB4_9EURO|nr:ketoacyl-synt-domain-containing protein [Aspergillus costaricaensis CBS 115574]RAK87875.1 ketoacyl-synt-domain-containing protein [Aspergillus costaricaensis CBS 115574]